MRPRRAVRERRKRLGLVRLSNRTIRIGLVATAVLGALAIGSVGFSLFGIERPRDPMLWEARIAAFEADDSEEPPPKGAVLFVGSSSIRLWETLQKDFPRHRVINRGFGGAHIKDVTAFADRIVLPYEPRMILLYAGDNDLVFHRDPERVLEDFKEFVAVVHGRRPKTMIGFISIKPSIKRWALIGRIRRANRLVRAWTASTSGVRYIDVFNPMLGDDGELKEMFFAEDGLHLNREGYGLWQSVIRTNLPPPLNPPQGKENPSPESAPAP